MGLCWQQERDAGTRNPHVVRHFEPDTSTGGWIYKQMLTAVDAPATLQRGGPITPPPRCNDPWGAQEPVEEPSNCEEARDRAASLEFGDAAEHASLYLDGAQAEDWDAVDDEDDRSAILIECRRDWC